MWPMANRTRRPARSLPCQGHEAPDAGHMHECAEHGLVAAQLLGPAGAQEAGRQSVPRGGGPMETNHSLMPCSSSLGMTFRAHSVASSLQKATALGRKVC